MNKKITVLFLILTLCINQLSFKVLAENTQNYIYTESNGEITITKYTGPDISELSIPGTIDGKPVTVIADSSFTIKDPPADGTPVINPVYFTELKKIIFPENIRYIGRIFSNCPNLEIIEIPSTVTEIKRLPSLFTSNFKLQAINVSHNNLNYSSENGILFNKDKSELIHYPYNKIGTDYTIPLSVTTLGSFSIRSIYLHSIYIQEKTKNISSYSIKCNSLNSINVSSENPYFTSQDGVLYSKDRTRLIKYPENKNTPEFILPSNVEKIESSAISSENLKSVTVQESVYNISDNNFTGCPNLQNINVSESNPTFSSVDGVLFDKDKLKLINYPQGKNNTVYSVPAGVDTIEGNAFMNVKAITRINMPDSVKNLKNSPFWSCENLKSIYFYGNAPEASHSVFFGLINKDFKFYYAEGSEGFTNPWNGYAAESFEGAKYEVIYENKSLNPLYFSEGLAAVLLDTGDAQLGNRWGYIDTAGKIVINPKYLFADAFHEGVAIVKDTEDFNVKVIDKSGKVKIDSDNLIRNGESAKGIYSSAAYCGEGLIGFNFDEFGCTDFYNLDGNFIVGNTLEMLMWLLPFSENISCGVFLKNVEGSKPSNGFIDKSGKITYTSNTSLGNLFSFNQGLALAGDEDENRNIKYGFIDKTGKYAINPQFDDISIAINGQVFIEGIAAVSQDNKWGCIDTTGKFVISPMWDKMTYFKDNIAWVKKDNKWGCIDTKGKIVIRPMYENFTEFSGGIALVQIGQKFYYIDKNGYNLGELKADIDAIGSINANGIINTIKNNLYGVIKITGTNTSSSVPEVPTPTPTNTPITSPIPSIIINQPVSPGQIPPAILSTNSPTPAVTATPTATVTPSPTSTLVKEPVASKPAAPTFKDISNHWAKDQIGFQGHFRYTGLG
jgi:hypothetical protein